MSLYRLDGEIDDLQQPVLIAALDTWIDAGGASVAAVERIADGGPVVATFDANRLFDYRARRPTLEIVDGRLADLSWPELVVRRTRLADRDVLVLAGAEPDYRWPQLAADVLELAGRLGVAEWVSLGAIPAAVPHTRPVPILGSASRPGLLRGGVEAGPAGTLRVPAAALSVLERTIGDAGIPAVGYYAQIPHYVSGPYPAAAVALLRAIAAHFGTEVLAGDLAEEAKELRDRLDAATVADDTTRTYVSRLEALHDESRLPSGDDLIADIERFLRERGTERGG